MEPPKKRKYPITDDDLVDQLYSGECVASSDSVMSDSAVSDSLVSDSGTMVAAKRNRRSYSLEFKVSVLDGYYHDQETRLNQRKTAIKYGVNRRQIQKWLAQEETLRGSVGVSSLPTPVTAPLVVANKTTLSTYLNYQSKINYLRQLDTQEDPVTVVEVTPEFGEHRDFVIDEKIEDKRLKVEDDDDYDESVPINLSRDDVREVSADREKVIILYHIFT